MTKLWFMLNPETGSTYCVLEMAQKIPNSCHKWYVFSQGCNYYMCKYFYIFFSFYKSSISCLWIFVINLIWHGVLASPTTLFVLKSTYLCRGKIWMMFLCFTVEVTHAQTNGNNNALNITNISVNNVYKPTVLIILCVNKINI